MRKRPAPSPSSAGAWKLRRSILLAGFLAFWAVVLVGRLYQLQVIRYAKLLARAQQQQQRTIEIAPQRGTIYDHLMHPLAMSLAVDSVYAVPSQIADPAKDAKLLAPILDVDASDLLGRFQASRTFCWVKRKVTKRQSAEVHKLKLKGIYFQKEMKRFYPKGSLAAAVLGYVGLDDRGLAGIEYQLDKQIRGRAGHVLVDADARRQSFHSTDWGGEPGKNVVLTLDENIQYIAEKALDRAVKKWHALDGTVIVQNPTTGDILALATTPTFDPNDYQQFPPKDRMDRAVRWIYEPGSTFKSITVSSVLDDGLASPTDLVDCQMGQIRLGGRIIHDVSDLLPLERQGPLTLTQVLEHSSDVGAVKMALRLGEDRFYRRIREFGIGSKTGVGLPGEENGLLMPPARWSGVTIGEIAIGQGVAVTPMQMVRVYSAIADGGIMVRPRVVRDVFRGDDHSPGPPTIGRRVISPQTAEEMRQMLEGVVEHGTGTNAQLPGYTSAGKTGTAQKVGPNGTYSHKDYVASFIGFAPATHPAVTILVVIDTPVGAIYGAEVAAPVFRSIAEQTLGYLNIPQDNPSWWPQVASSAPAGLPRQQRRSQADRPPLEPEPTGAASSPVQNVAYRFTSPAPDPPTVMLDEGPLVQVPNFSGKAVRSVVEECQQMGLDLSLSGTGLAVEQNPLPGRQVPPGARVWVRFAR